MQPDTRGAPPASKVLAFPAGAPEAVRRSRRDPRIDLFRGLALVMILVTHIPGNPYEWLTVREIGFSDAAEAFFLMSGIAAGIAYSAAFLRWGDGTGTLWQAVGPLWRRAWSLYLVQILLTVWALSLYGWAAETFLRAQFRTNHNIAAIYEHTGTALGGLGAMGYQIGYVNILPTYVVLLLAAPLGLWGAIRAPWVTLAVSTVLWFASGFWRLNLPVTPGQGGWFLSPFAWQLPFVLGLAIGVRHRQGRRLVPVARWAVTVATAFLILAYAWRHVPGLGAFLNHKMAVLGALGTPWNLVAHTKTWLGLPRLLHALALLYVLSSMGGLRDISGRAWGAPLRLLGRQGLLVFGLGTVLALSCQILIAAEPTQAWLRWILPPVAFAILLVAAALRDGTWPRRPRPAAAAPSDAAPADRGEAAR